MLIYNELKNKPREFLAATGLKLDEFEQLLPTFQMADEKQDPPHLTQAGKTRQRQIGGGATGALPKSEDKLFFILVYQKTTPLQTMHGWHFGLSQPQANDWIHRLLPVLQQALRALGEAPERDARRVATSALARAGGPDLTMDGSERRRQRPQAHAKQKEHYSGKTKAHTDKNILRVNKHTKKVVMKWTRPLCGPAAMSQNDFQTCETIQPQETSPMNQHISVLGIDLAKRVFHVVGMNERGQIVLRKRLSRPALMPFIATLPPVLIGMEACGGAHYWARRFREHHHEVKLMAPQFVKPYVKSNKNDMRDAEGIGEAVTRPTMRFVPTKDVTQQDMQALHRVRERLMGARTALVNEVHGLLNEYGIVVPKGVSKFRQTVVGKLESEQAKLTPLSQEMFWKLVEEFAALEEQIAYYQAKLDTLATTHPACQRLMTIPGIGPLTATALVAAVSDASAFKNGRQFAAWLGLVPRQHATGGKERLLGISKRGDSYLRKLLVHGARTTLRWVGRKTDRRSQWMRQLVERRGKNRTAVAVANKNARIVWALLTSHQDSQPATV